jgi:hypothetical protein
MARRERRYVGARLSRTAGGVVALSRADEQAASSP